MLSTRRKNILTGGVLILLGTFVTYYALTHYTIGQLSRIGSAVFPAAIGVILAILGLLLAVTNLVEEAEEEQFPLRPTVAILGSILVFALVVDRSGLVPAVILLVAGAILADNQHSWRSGIMLTATTAAMTGLIFWALGMSFTLARWPL